MLLFYLRNTAYITSKHLHINFSPGFKKNVGRNIHVQSLLMVLAGLPLMDYLEDCCDYSRGHWQALMNSLFFNES